MRTRQVLAWIVSTLMASPVLAGPTDLKSILDGSRHVLIVPVEPPPLTISTPGIVNQIAQAAGVEGSNGTSSSPIVSPAGSGMGTISAITMILTTPGSARAAGQVANRVESTVSEEGAWIPTRVVAALAAAELEKRGAASVRIRDGVQPIPELTDRSMTMSMHNWYGPLDRYFRASKSPYVYAAPETNSGDLVLEASIGNYEYAGGTFILAVRLKLVDPATGNVLSKGAGVSYRNIGKPAEAFSNQGERFKNAFAALAQELVEKSLRKMGLP